MATYPRFGERTEASEVAAAFGQNIRDKTILITGVAPNGLGAATAAALASQHPAMLILAARSLPKAEKVVSDLKKDFPNIHTKTLELDLASQDSIRRAAAEVLAYPDSAIDVLINNAGVMRLESDRILTEAGLEMHFATNHLGHWLFTNLIMNKIIAGAEKRGSARIINVASNSHLASPIRFHDINLEKLSRDLPEEERPIEQWLRIFGVVGDGAEYEALATKQTYNSFVAYAQSKTANVSCAVAWSEKLKALGVQAFSLNPGAIVTELQRTTDREVLERAQSLMYWKTQSQGTATQLVAAFDPLLERDSGAYLENCQVVDSAPFAADKEMAQRLWKLSEGFVGQTFPF